MAVIKSDVLRPETGETGLAMALRNRQTGYATDTFKMIHKFEDGTIKKYVPEDQLNVFGMTGIKGEVGDQGATGVAGETGPLGFTGLQGAQGIQGPTGAIGPQGATGAQGLIGATGLMGPTGVMGSTGMLITPEGAIIVPIVNNRGSTLYQGTLLKAKTDTYPNGVTLAEEDCENVVGVVYDTLINNGAVGWMVVHGYCYVQFDELNKAFKGELWGMANLYSLSNLGKAKCWTGMNMAHAMGYCIEDSGAAPDYGAICYLNSLPHGIAGRDTLSFDNDFVTDNDINIEYVKTGSQVVVHFPAHTDYSNSENLNFLAWPSKLTPKHENQVSNAMAAPICFQRIGSTLTDGHVFWQWDSLNGARFQIYDGGAIGWGDTGLKGIYYPTQIMYHL